MKRVITFLLLIFMMIAIFPETVAAGNEPAYSIQMSKQPTPPPAPNPNPNPDPNPDPYIDPYDPDIDEEGHRAPARPFNCIISPIGIDIPSIDKNDIISFEVYDQNGICIACFIDEQDFLSFLFSTSGAVEIIFRTDGYLLRGFIDR